MSGFFEQTTTPYLSAAKEAFGTDRPNNDALRPSPYPLRHSQTFQGMVTTAAKSYWWAFDEALRQSPEDARAMRRDGYLIALLRERQRPVGRAKWHIESEDETDPRQKDAVTLMTDLIGRIPRFSRMRMKLRECDWFGRYATQMVASKERLKGRDVWGVTNWLPVNGDKLIFRHDGTPGVLVWGRAAADYRAQGATVKSTERGEALFLDSPAWRERFVIDTFEIDDADWYEPELAGGIAGVGLRHHVQWLWWLRAEVMAQLLDYMAQVGAGGLTLIGYEDGNPIAEKAADKIAKDLESGNVLKVPKPKGTSKETNTVDRIEPSDAGASILMQIVDTWFDAKIERLFVGQKMSSDHTGSGGLGGSGAADLAGDTKYQLIAGDAEDLDETLTADLIGPLMRWNLPQADFRLKFVTDLSKPDSDKALESANKAYSMGVEFKEDEIRALTGLSKPQPGDKLVSQRMSQLGGLQNAGLAGQPGMAGMAGPGGPPGAGGPPPDGPGGQPMPGGDLEGEDEIGMEGEGGDTDQSTPDIRQYFTKAIDEGLLFSSQGLQKLKRELESGGWRWTVGHGLQRLSAYGEPVPAQYAKVQWSPYTNPHTGQQGWKSAGGRVMYDFDPNAYENRYEQNAEPKPEQDTSEQRRDTKARRHVGIEKGKTGGKEAIGQRITGLLENPESVTPKSMRMLVDDLLTLTNDELADLGQQYGGSRGRKHSMVEQLHDSLQGKGLPAASAGWREDPKAGVVSLADVLKGGRLDIDASPAVAATAAPQTQPGDVQNVPTGDLKVDPARFQFKQNTNALGVTPELSKVQKWNADFAGTVAGWKDPQTGEAFVVNGHHRHELATRLGVPTLPVRFIDAPNAEAARARGALINIAEGRGTAVDAAKFLRDSGMPAESMESDYGVSLKGALARDAGILTRLSDPLFHKLATGQLDQDRALALAPHLKPELQGQLVDWLDKREQASGKQYHPKVVSEFARQMAATPTTTSTDTGLFGSDEHEESLFAARGELAAGLRGELSREANDWKAVASDRRAGTVGETNTLDVEGNKGRARGAHSVRELFDQFAHVKGPVADTLNQFAGEYANAKTTSERARVKAAALAAVRGAAESEGGLGGPQAVGAGQPAPAPAPITPAPEPQRRGAEPARVMPSAARRTEESPHVTPGRALPAPVAAPAGPAAGGAAVAPQPHAPPGGASAAPQRPAGVASGKPSPLERLRALQKAKGPVPVRTAAPVAPKAPKPGGLTPAPSNGPRADTSKVEDLLGRIASGGPAGMTKRQAEVLAAVEAHGGAGAEGAPAKAAKDLNVSREAVGQNLARINKLKGQIGRVSPEDKARAKAEKEENRMDAQTAARNRPVAPSEVSGDYDPETERALPKQHVSAKHKDMAAADLSLDQLTSQYLKEVKRGPLSPERKAEYERSVARLHEIAVRAYQAGQGDS